MALTVFSKHYEKKPAFVRLLAAPNFAADLKRGMPRLNTIDRERAIVRLQAGDTQNAVANDLGVAVSIISRLWTRLQATGSTRDQEGRGRPRVTSARQDRRILPAAETARNTIGNHNAPVSGHTIRRRLSERDLRCRRPARRPMLTARHRHSDCSGHNSA